MESVGFTRMEDGTSEDYELLDRLEQPYLEALPTGCSRRSTG